MSALTEGNGCAFLSLPKASTKNQITKYTHSHTSSACEKKNKYGQESILRYEQSNKKPRKVEKWQKLFNLIKNIYHVFSTSSLNQQIRASVFAIVKHFD